MPSLGIYDSGIGGLTISNAIREIFPDMAITYFADEKIMPIGEKSRDFIIERLKNACQYLFDHDCPLIILACNTASVVAIRHLQETWVMTEHAGKRNILGINKPLVETMEEQYADLREKEGLLVSTLAAYDAGYFQGELEMKGFTHLETISSPDLATAIEDGDEARVTTDIVQVVRQLSTSPEQVAYVILACTHYPFAGGLFKKYFPNARIIDQSQSVAGKFEDYLRRHSEYQIGKGTVQYLTTGDAGEFAGIVERVTGETIEVKHIDL